MGTRPMLPLKGFLIDPENWRAIEGTPDLRGRYVLGLDLGGSEAFTAAAAVYETGGIACLQACGGHLSLAKKEEKENLTTRLLCPHGPGRRIDTVRGQSSAPG